MADDEAWSVLPTDEEIKAMWKDVNSMRATIEQMSAQQAEIHIMVTAMHQKLHQDSVRRRNKNLRQKVPFPFRPENEF